MRAAPGLLRQVLCMLLYHPDERLKPVAINQPLTAGEIRPIAGGIEVIHTPGHCAGQVALLWRPRRMLFAGDVCMNIMGLGDPLGFETLKEGRASQHRVASLHSMLPGSAMVGLSTAMRRRVSAISGARNRLLDIGDSCFEGEARNPLVSWPADKATADGLPPFSRTAIEPEEASTCRGCRLG